MIYKTLFKFDKVDLSWQSCLQDALHKIDSNYFDNLQKQGWLPGPSHIFNAFSLPLNQVNYILFGESPYPRAHSANGYAFWDADVKELWSETGLTTKVNRATSLRNFIKMLLIAEGLLEKQNTSQDAIAKIDKKQLIKTNDELFSRLIQHGFLLLNASLVLQTSSVNKDAKAWQPFIAYILEYLYHSRPEAQVVLFGNIANKIKPLIKHSDTQLIQTEHPYNNSFITNMKVIQFFKPFHLLKIEG